MEVVKSILSDEQRGCDGLKVMIIAEGDLQEFLVNEFLDMNCKIYALAAVIFWMGFLILSN